MRQDRERFSIALLPALGPSGHPFGDGLTAGQWMAESVRDQWTQETTHGMGTIPAMSIAYGSPANVIRSRRREEILVLRPKEG